MRQAAHPPHSRPREGPLVASSVAGASPPVASKVPAASEWVRGGWAVAGWLEGPLGSTDSYACDGAAPDLVAGAAKAVGDLAVTAAASSSVLPANPGSEVVGAASACC